MIEVQGLTRFYADRPAIQDLTFSVPRGHVRKGLIINQGSLVADDTPANLARSVAGGHGAELEMVLPGDRG